MRFQHRWPNFSLDADVNISERERVAIVGPNGSGKSTLLDLWAQANRHQGRTTVTVDQRALCFPHMSVLDNVAFSFEIAGRSRKQARNLSRSALEAVGLDSLAHKYPLQLSGGQQQRVVLQRALGTGAACLLLDEPTSALDAVAARDYRAHLAGQIENLEQLVFVSHDPSDIMKLAERVIVMARGVAVADLSVQQLFMTPPNEFTSQLVDCNRLVRQESDGTEIVMWFNPGAAELRQDENHRQKRDVLLPVVVTAVDPRPHVVRVTVETREPDRQHVQVDVDPKLSKNIIPGLHINLHVTSSRVRVSEN